MIYQYEQLSTGYLPVTLPRWVNLDDRTVLDRLTGFCLKLTTPDKPKPPAVMNAEAMEVVDALNRIYRDEPTYQQRGPRA